MRRGCHLKYRIHGKEQGSILLRHRIIKKKYLDLASTRFRIHSVFKNVHSGEQIQKSWGFVCRNRRIRVDGAESVEKKLRIQKIYYKIYALASTV